MLQRDFQKIGILRPVTALGSGETGLKSGENRP